MNTEEPDDLDRVLTWLRAREAQVSAPKGFAAAVRARLLAGAPERERRAVLHLVHSLAEQPVLTKRLQASRSRSELLDALRELGAQRGMHFSTEAAAAVLTTLRAANDDNELTDEQLSAVAGGQGAMLLALGTLFGRLP